MLDTILQNHLKYDQVRRDLLLLKNQIPFFVLEELFRLTVEPIQVSSTTIRRGPVSLRRCVLSLFGDTMALKNIVGEIENLENNSPFHILHFFTHFPPISFAEVIDIVQHKEKPTFKYSATKFPSVGVMFRPRIRRESLFDFIFSTDRRCFCLWRRAHFKIPCFSINESIELLLRNFIVFEYCYPSIDNYFTSHAVTISILLDSAEDVELLEEDGVISNKLGFSEAV
ncbi:uncharacterized protein LOC132314013 [Cornus florida]|uniref:uncharacterized protein LOC132314013 n=1 Tax=Cornus florida TaxID=4283 RepID=UPI00289B388A|nr:uncharacterized protein LOC132314013 [Cornus florida]